MDLAEPTPVRATERRDEDGPVERSITFLDTPGLTLRRNGLVLRRRSAAGRDDEYTLKCRSEDRYVAAGTDVGAARGSDPDEKLEEDIAPPFRSRFSHSNTVGLPGGPPRSVAEAGETFPFVRTVAHDGRPLAADTPLAPVHQITVFERVYAGGKLDFPGMGPDGDDEHATVALILWSGKSGRPLVAEFSFRIKDKRERFSRALALAARTFFEVLQGHDWCRPGALTKTEFIYRDTRGD